MATWLKQSTTVTIQLGPFLDDTDGKTAETGLTVEDTDIYLSKNGAAFANPHDTNNAAHDASGWYRKELDDTDTGTLGRLIVMCHESGALPVWREFMVVPANEYDSLISGSDALEVDATLIEGSAAKAAIESEVDDALGGGTGTALTAIPWNANWDAEVQSEVNDALVALHLDHLLAADYDPASKPGVATALLNELIESDGGVSRFTANALEQGPNSGDVVDGTYTLAEAVSLLLAVLCGKVTGGGTTTITFRDTADSTNRVVMTVDASGNRSAVALNES